VSSPACIRRGERRENAPWKHWRGDPPGVVDPITSVAGPTDSLCPLCRTDAQHCDARDEQRGDCDRERGHAVREDAVRLWFRVLVAVVEPVDAHAENAERGADVHRRREERVGAVDE
jgi:hypothetical protein